MKHPCQARVGSSPVSLGKQITLNGIKSRITCNSLAVDRPPAACSSPSTANPTARMNADGSSPASDGVSLENLAGTSLNQNPDTSTQTLAVTVAVPAPEPATAALATLAAAALLLHGRRRLIALSG
jgi:hypothetical protein